MKKNRTCVTVNTPQELKDAIQKVADDNRRSLSSQIILIIEEFLAKLGK